MTNNSFVASKVRINPHFDNSFIQYLLKKYPACENLTASRVFVKQRESGSYSDVFKGKQFFFLFRYFADFRMFRQSGFMDISSVSGSLSGVSGITVPSFPDSAVSGAGTVSSFCSSETITASSAFSLLNGFNSRILSSIFSCRFL